MPRVPTIRADCTCAAPQGPHFGIECLRAAGGFFFAPRLLLRCRCEGPFVEYPGGKIACSVLTPMDVQPLPPGYLHTSPHRAPAAVPLEPGFFGPSEGLRLQTSALEAEVADMERRLGYRA
mmetsp:Transcript_31633/g.71106  ORF Transcript_31633/g.71106 Transcript_31633/m.71106 type:complete len:121 (-) Transcript_31633:29-391(-)